MAHSHSVVAKSVAAFAVLVASCVSCGGSGSATGPNAVAVTVTMSRGAASVLIGETRSVVARDQNGNELSGMTWTTSASAVATVSQAGVLTAVGDGSATITATGRGTSGSLTISVVGLTFASVATGGAHTCALTTNGAAYCWGRGEFGQLGVASGLSPCLINEQTFSCSAIPVAVQGGLAFTHLDAGTTHTCGITSTGAAYCWGQNNAGQLGDNSTTNLFTDQKSAPALVAGGLVFTSISAAALHTCALTASGAAYCWGANGAGQLGDGTTTNRAAPTLVGGGLSFAKVTTGGYAQGLTCALANTGVAYCWGENRAGQIGLGTTDTGAHSSPAPVSGGVAFATLTAGASHNCGLTPGGNAHCWGANVLGALGDGTTLPKAAPAPVSGGIAFAHIAIGGFSNINAHTCGLTVTGQAYCWGDNGAGALGDGSLSSQSVPTAVIGQRAFRMVDSGFRHTCALATTGILYCWGSNGAGQLGIDLFALQSSPTRVLGQR